MFIVDVLLGLGRADLSKFADFPQQPTNRKRAVTGVTTAGIAPLFPSSAESLCQCRRPLRLRSDNA